MTEELGVQRIHAMNEDNSVLVPVSIVMEMAKLQGFDICKHEHDGLDTPI